MPLIIVIAFLLFTLPLSIRAETPHPTAINFVKNANQWDKDVLYRANIPGGYLFIKAHSLVYSFYDTQALSRMHLPTQSVPKARINVALPRTDLIDAHGIEVVFNNVNPAATVEASNEVQERKNFFLGKNPSRWAASVPAFTEIIYRNLYPGIDLKLYTQGASLKYEFIVSPKADVKQIQLTYAGATHLQLQEGALQIKTSVNTITESKPYTYQLINGQEQKVASDFVLKGNTLGFHFPEGYNKKQPLIIDPYLVFSTYSGSFSDNFGFTATNDAEGNLYAGGIEFGTDFPVTVGAFQVSFSGEIDVAILKFNPQGTSLLYATYLGGLEADVPHSMIVNSSNELIIMGTTSSDDFPVTAGAYDLTLNKSESLFTIVNINYFNGAEIFLTKLNAAGTDLAGSTYLGGTGDDGVNADIGVTRNYGDEFRGEVNLDAAGNIYIASTTTSADFPLVNPSSASLQGRQDAIVAKFDPGLTTLLWSTYFGGSGFEAASGIRISGSGNVYICGGTTSNDLPASPASVKPALTDEEDGYLAKFTSNTLTAATYIGTPDNDLAYFIDLDGEENVYVMGITFGTYPVTANVYQNANGKQFIHALSNNFTQTLFSTVIGSGRSIPDLSPTAFMVSDCGFIYLSGWGGIVNRNRGINLSNTIGLPVTPDALRSTSHVQTSMDGEDIGDDFYLMILSRNATELLYATFFGGPSGNNHVDGGTSRFDKKGTIYHAACACRDNNTFPTSLGAWSRVNNGDSPNAGEQVLRDGCNNVAFKFDLDGLKADFDISGNGTYGKVEGCAPFTASFANLSQGGKTYEWNIAGIASSNSLTPDTVVLDKPGEYVVKLKVFNPQTCKQVDSVAKVIKVYPASFNVSPGTRICPGASAQLKAEGGITYAWEPATGLSDPTAAAPVATPLTTTNYTVTITNEFNCVEKRTVLVEVENQVVVDFNLIIDSECGKPARVQFTNNTAGAQNFLWFMGTGDTLSGADPEFYDFPIKGGVYEVVLKAFNGLCESTNRQTITVESGELPPNVVTPNSDANNQTFVAPNANSSLEIYNRWGRPVYQSDSYQNDWGPEVPNGVYFYMLTSPQGTRCKGWIHVLK